MYITIDLGGTHTRIASSHDCKTISSETKFKTQPDIKSQQSMMLESINSMGEGIAGICIGVTGFVDQEKKIALKNINVPYLSNLSFDEILGKNLADNIYCINDAALAGLGEAVYGSGKNYKCVSYLTLSTGVGGIRIYDKQLDLNQKYFEPGHMITNTGAGKSLQTGQVGSFDSYASGVSFVERYKIHPKDCLDQKVWDDYGKNVAHGLINIVSMWAPDIIVLGGSVSLMFDKFSTALTTQLKYLNNEVFILPEVVAASLWHESALYGGFHFIKTQLDNKGI